MSTLFKAITTKDTRTENGMPTHSTSSNAILDMFYKMGGSRTMSETAITAMFSKAFNSDDRLLATKAMFYNRDVRGGQGERRSFRIMFRYLCMNYPEIAVANLSNVVFFGRWDDLLVGLDTVAGDAIAQYIYTALRSGDGLCAKWMPRENKANGATARLLISKIGIPPKRYRKLLSGNTKAVENIMCKKDWALVDYNQVPSVAVNKYRKAWYRNDESRFSSWIESLSKPEFGNKINASSIFPHDIVGKYLGGGMYGVNVATGVNELLEAQWEALPNYVQEARKILPVVDVSGSMGMYGGLAIRVAVALGIYISQRNSGPFKDGFITFSENPMLQYLTGNLHDRCEQLTKSKWGMNTDLEKVFKLILDRAVSANLPASEMPDDVLILSDMQFDQCVSNRSASAIEMIDRLYSRAGYKRPNIVFWNLKTSEGIPVKHDDNGVALVSGFSPSLMKSLLNGSMTPMATMLAVLESERYERVV